MYVASGTWRAYGRALHALCLQVVLRGGLVEYCLRVRQCWGGVSMFLRTHSA